MSWQMLARGDESTPVRTWVDDGVGSQEPTDGFKGAPGAQQYNGGAVDPNWAFANPYISIDGKAPGSPGLGEGSFTGPKVGSYYFPSADAARAGGFPSYGKITDSPGFVGGLSDAWKDFSPAIMGSDGMPGPVGAALGAFAIPALMGASSGATTSTGDLFATQAADDASFGTNSLNSNPSFFDGATAGAGTVSDTGFGASKVPTQLAGAGDFTTGFSTVEGAASSPVNFAETGGTGASAVPGATSGAVNFAAPFTQAPAPVESRLVPNAKMNTLPSSMGNVASAVTGSGAIGDFVDSPLGKTSLSLGANIVGGMLQSNSQQKQQSAFNDQLSSLIARSNDRSFSESQAAPLGAVAVKPSATLGGGGIAQDPAATLIGSGRPAPTAPTTSLSSGTTPAPNAPLGDVQLGAVKLGRRPQMYA